MTVPDLEEQNYIHEKYISELVNGVFLQETRERLLAIANALKARSKIDGLILGGTELPLILRNESEGGILLLDTTLIHVKAALDKMFSGVVDRG